jgi:hypothetical protein
MDEARVAPNPAESRSTRIAAFQKWRGIDTHFPFVRLDAGELSRKGFQQIP